MMTNEGGTVRYHHKECRPGSDYPWMVRFMEGGPIHELTKAEGEAMGLTPPEPAPAPLVVECNGHSIELSDEQVVAFLKFWDLHQSEYPSERLCIALAGLLRDARQDPQPASDLPTVEIGGQVMTQAQYDAARFPLIDTETHPVGIAVQTDLQPEQDDTPGIDFDALPIGTVLKSATGYYCTKGSDGMWWDSEERRDCHDMRRATWLLPYTVVITGEPAPVLSPRQCLEALLAGRDDADELIEYAEQWGGRGLTPDGRWRAVIGDAARGGA